MIRINLIIIFSLLIILKIGEDYKAEAQCTYDCEVWGIFGGNISCCSQCMAYYTSTCSGPGCQLCSGSGTGTTVTEGCTAAENAARAACAGSYPALCGFQGSSYLPFQGCQCKQNCAPPPQCIPYVPIVKNAMRSGVIPVGQECTPLIRISVPFGVILAGDPIVAQRGFKLGFTGDRRFGLGSIKIMNGPFIVGGDKVVEFDVQVCFRDVDVDQEANWEFAYSVGAWPIELTTTSSLPNCTLSMCECSDIPGSCRSTMTNPEAVECSYKFGNQGACLNSNCRDYCWDYGDGGGKCLGFAFPCS